MPESKEKKKKTKPGQASAPAVATPVSERKTAAEKKPVAKKEPPKPTPPVRPLVSFNRWFRGKGFKDHWKVAMQAYANTSGRRSVEEWDQLFEKY
jgi:hypothetical protein